MNNFRSYRLLRLTIHNSNTTTNKNSNGKNFFSTLSSTTNILHYEWIVPVRKPAAAVPTIITNRQPSEKEEEEFPSVIIFLHGLLGNIRNIRTMANKICQIKKNTYGLLIDLPGHGGSFEQIQHDQQNHLTMNVKETLPTSKIIHTIKNEQKEEIMNFNRACEQIQATILKALQDHHATNIYCQQPVESSYKNKDDSIQTVVPNILKDTSLFPPLTFVGHSLGGRIALHYIHNNHDKYNEVKVNQLWLLDTVPGKIDSSVHQVLQSAQQIVTDLPQIIQQIHNKHQNKFNKKEFTNILMKEPYHLNATIAQWLVSSFNTTTNTFNFDLSIANQFVTSIQEQDLLNVLESILTRRDSVTIHLIRGGKNLAWEKNPKTIQALDQLTETTTTTMTSTTTKNNHSKFTTHVLPTAGHWVHIDDLPGLLKVFESETIH